MPDFVICPSPRHKGPVVGAMLRLPIERCTNCRRLDFEEEQRRRNADAASWRR